jgi:O-antigen ligase
LVDLFPLLVLLQAGGDVRGLLWVVLGQGESPQDTLNTALWLMLYAVSCFLLLARHGRDWFTWMLRHRLSLCLVLAIASLSFLWSINPGLSVQRAIHLVGTSLAAICIGYLYSAQSLSRSLAVILAVTLLTAPLTVAILPDIGIEDYQGGGVWRGLQTNKNALGFVSAVGLLFFLVFGISAVSKVTKLLFGLLFVLALLCLYMSHSATSLAALVLSVFVTTPVVQSFRFQIDLKAIALLMIGTALLAVAVAAAVGFGGSLNDWTGLLARSADFTGRGYIWEPTWQLIRDNPWLGLGYGALWFPRADAEWFQQQLLGLSWTAFSAHNGLLQVASEIGLIASALAIYFVLSTVVRTFLLLRARSTPFLIFAFAYECLYVISNFFEANMFVDRTLSWVLFLALPIAAERAGPER